MAGTEALNIVITGENSDVIRKIEEIVKAISGVQGKSITLNADASQAVGEAGKVASAVEHIGDAHANITVDGTQAVTEAEKASNAVGAVNDSHSEITADGTQAISEAGKVADAEEALNNAHVEITADGTQAVNEAAKASEAVGGVHDVQAVISADGSQAINEAGKVSEAEESLKDAHINITADSSQALDEAEKIADAEKSLNDSHIEITADSSQAVSEAVKVSEAVENINDSHVEITADGSQAVDEVGKIADAENSINDAHVEITANGEQAVNEIHRVSDAEEGVKDAHSEITADGSQAIGEATAVQSALDGVHDKEVNVTADTSQAEGRIRSIQEILDTIDRNIELKFSDNDFIRQFRKVAEFRAIGRQAGEGFSSGFSSTANNGINSLKDSFNALLSMNIGEKISASFGAAFSSITSMLQKAANLISGVMKSALGVGGGFEAQMTNVKVISGATEEEFDKLTKKAREMGATLPITAKDAATAMQMLVQRGTNAADTLATVDSVANLAIAQSGNMGDVAELLGMAMSSFSIDISEAAKVTAVFNNACNQSPLSLQRLMAAMKYAAPAAGSLGISLTEAVAAMEAISRVLPSGEMTGTGYAMVLSKVAAKSEIAGVKTRNLDGSLRSIKDIFLDLKEAQASYAELNKVFGQRGVKAALALMQNAEALEGYEERLKDYGTTQGAVDEKAKTFTNTMAALTSAIEEFHINVFDQIKDKSKETVSSITALIRVFSDWVGQTQIAGKSLSAFLEGLGFKIPSGDEFRKLLDTFDVQAFVDKVKDLGESLKGIADKIVWGIEKIKSPLLWLIEHLDTFMTISFWGWISGKALQIPAAIMGIVFAFKELAAAGKLLASISWAAMLNPIGAVVGIGGAVAGTAIYLQNKADNARNKAFAEELRAKSEAEIKRLETSNANYDLQLDVNFNIKTGFEKLPESFESASAELRQEVKETVAFLQEQFRDKAASAVEFVSEKFPDMAEAFKGTANDISDEILTHISAALYGSEQDFEALPEFWRKVAERINAVSNGLDKLGIEFMVISDKYSQLKQEIEKPLATQIDPNTALLQSISATVQSVMTELPAEIERAKQFLSGADGELVVQVSLTEAQEKLENFIKSAKKEYSVSPKFVESTIISQLQALADSGNAIAESLLNSWGKTEDKFFTFIANATDAVEMLGTAPETFDTTIEQLYRKIKDIDPLTGRITEQAKKAHKAMKEWNNLSFSKLTESIEALKKAIKSGFAKKKDLEAMFEAASNQVKLKVVTDLRPMANILSPEAFHKTIASEYISTMKDLGGDVFAKKMNQEFLLLTDRTTEALGRSILGHVDSDVHVEGGTFSINGADQITQGLEAVAALPQNIANAVSPYVMRLEQLNPIQGNLNTANITSPIQVSATPANSANDFSSLTIEFQKLTTAIDGAKSFIEGNTSALRSVSEGVLSLVNSSGSTAQSVSYSAIKDYSADIALVVKALQDSSAANVQAVNDVTSAVGLVEAAVKSQSQQESFTPSNELTPQTNLNVDFSPVVTALNDILTSLGSVQSLAQANNEAVNNVAGAVNSVEEAVKSQQDGTTLDTGALTQALIGGIAPFISSLEQTSGVYQSSSSLLAGNVQSLGQNIDSLTKSTEGSISALSQVQTALTASQSQNTSIDLSQVISELQGISATLKAVQNQNDGSQDFSSAIAPLLNELQNIVAGLASVQNSSQANIQAVNDVANAVISVEKAVTAQQTVNEGSITQAVIGGFAPLVSRIEQNSATYQASSSSMTRSLQELGTIIDALKKSADTGNSAMTQLQSSVKAAADSYDATNITSAVTPIAGAVQNLATALGVIQAIQQANSAAINEVISSVHSVEKALKDMNSGNTYDIDIIQQGFSVASKADADYTARSAASALRSGIGNGGI
ncbi:MAG: phage tail tape measure protein [Synergistaceae bacterium]|nr:phage tail tape measure protein [Synergistaceae bacterium]MBR0248654.1 phage tail tape measure protein [Synergistaceae bacterium]